MKKKYTYLIKRLFYYIYGEKFFRRLDYDWKKYPSRTEIIQKIINLKKSKFYLEIGCDQDENYSKIKIENKIGVDPVSGGTHRMTSDEFFLKNEKTFDIIYIDGLHYYKQASNDIRNSIKVLNNNGVIILHDCLPVKIWEQIVPRIYGHWTGDVWKAIVEARTIKEVDTYTCIADHGLSIILKRPNRNLLSEEIKNFENLKFKEYYNSHNKLMNLINVSDLEKIIN